jgi:hypothetical protein
MCCRGVRDISESARQGESGAQVRIGGRTVLTCAASGPSAGDAGDVPPKVSCLRAACATVGNRAGGSCAPCPLRAAARCRHERPQTKSPARRGPNRPPAGKRTWCAFRSLQ